jgi:CubicO group peptidase (beta-lactamase class C family)
MYRPLALGGEFGGVRLVPEDAVPAMAAVTAAVAKDATMLVPTRWANGFMKGVDNTYLPPGQGDAVILSEEAFGHLGNGGSLGFADPRARLSFGYAMNRQGGRTGLEDRGQALVDAVYRVLGTAAARAAACGTSEVLPPVRRPGGGPCPHRPRRPSSGRARSARRRVAWSSPSATAR